MKPCLAVITCVYVLCVHVFNSLFGVDTRESKQRTLPSNSKSYPSHKRSASLLFCVLVLGSTMPINGQTTIVFRRTPTEVVIGADSLFTEFKVTVNSSGEVLSRLPTKYFSCKIIREGRRAFAFAGLSYHVADIQK